MRLRILLASALLSASVLPAAAQSVKVSFHEGKVDLSAQNATPRAILTEWARVGGTRLVNVERVTGSPMTLEFKNADEQQVLESLLRGVSGYMLGPRVTRASTSGFDRIVLLPTSSASVAAAPRPSAATPAFGRLPGPQPLRRLPQPVDDDQDVVEPDDDDPAADLPAPGRAETPADLRRRLGQLLQSPDDDTDSENDEPPPAPTNPFGVSTGAARPGVITPVPPQQPRGQQPRGTNQTPPTQE
jgi:hypothetical protein